MGRNRKIRPILDLHGITHVDAEIIIEDFILEHQCELTIITGKSHTMRSIVFEVLDRHEFEYSKWNPGSVRVFDDIL